MLFELRPTEVRCKGYGDVTLPEHTRWRADGDRDGGPAGPSSRDGQVVAHPTPG